MRSSEKFYREYPDFVDGYELDPEHSYFSVIIPEATTNLVTNPSFEGQMLTGYTAVAGSIALTLNWQAFGAAGLVITPLSGTLSGVYYGTVALTAGVTYTASVVLQGTPGREYFIGFYSTAGALLLQRKWIATGYKQRIHVTYVAASSAAHRIYITRTNYADAKIFYIDALQVEAKAYPTTYCDGDMKGFVLGETVYGWNGTPYVSTSYRTAQTRSGGREVNLRDLGLNVLAIIGLGMAPLVGQSLPMPGRGELFQGTGTTAREFSMITSLYGDGQSARHLQSKRNALINAFKPDITAKDQPMILRYQMCDEDGETNSESLDIICKYQTGLEGAWSSNQEERLALQFKMYLPLIQKTYSNGILLGYQTEVTDFANIGYRDTDGIWKAMSTGTNGNVYAIVKGLDGSIFIGGTFTLAGGVAGTTYIAKWNGTAFEPLGTGMSGTVFTLAIDAAGNLYAGGNFALASGVANTAYIAKWDGVNWTPLGTGMSGFIPVVRKIKFDSNGILYAAGDFTLAGGVANTLKVAKWNGTTWSALSAGATNGDMRDLTIGTDDSVYVVGIFTIIGGVAANQVAKWSGSLWEPMGTGFTNVFAGPTALGTGLDGLIYAGGSFLEAGGVLARRIAKWNGTIWSPVVSGADNAVLNITVGYNGSIFIGGFFTEAGGITMPDRIAEWKNGLWQPIDVNIADAAAYIYAILPLEDGRLYIGGVWAGTSAYSATVTPPYIEGSIAYPKVTIIGPGTIWQFKNYTTGKAIYFDNLTLLVGENVTLDFNPLSPSFVSSFRGNIDSYILPGSSMNIELVPGVNNISTYLFGSTGVDSKIFMTWQEQEWALDGAVFE